MLGLYDTWVARDICGTPFRAFWPFAADKPSQQAIRDERPFPVSVCWNGAVVFNAAPFLYTAKNSTLPSTQETSRLDKRGWKMIDDCESMAFPAHRSICARYADEA